jgi:hypothetical protein
MFTYFLTLRHMLNFMTNDVFHAHRNAHRERVYELLEHRDIIGGDFVRWWLLISGTRSKTSGRILTTAQRHSAPTLSHSNFIISVLSYA